MPSATPKSAQAAAAFDAVVARLGPNGEVSPDMALQAFALAVAPLPGVTPPSGAQAHLDANLAVAWVGQVWAQLSPEQQAAVQNAMQAMRDPYQRSRSSSGLKLASWDPAVTEPECGLFLSDPDPATPPADIPPTVEGYVDQMRSASEAISDHLNRPSLPKLAVCLLPPGILAGPALTRVFDEDHVQVGLPASCTVFLNSDAASDLSDDDMGFLIAYATFHCFIATADPAETLDSSTTQMIDPWLLAGSSAWAGATVAIQVFGGAGGNLNEVWALYLTTPKTSLFERTNDAIGFFAQVDQDYPSVWYRLDEAIRKGGGLQAFDALTGRRQSFTDLWSAGYFRNASLGPDWDIKGPGIPSDKAEAELMKVFNGVNLRMEAPGMAVSTAELSSSADVTILAGDHLRVHDSLNDFKVVQKQAYCTRNGGMPGACACPQDTVGVSLPPLPSLSTDSKLALTGLETYSEATIQGVSLDDYCGLKFKEETNCEIGIPPGDYTGTVLYNTTTKYLLHDGGGKIRFTVSENGSVKGSWDLAYTSKSSTGETGTGLVTAGVVGGTPLKLTLHGTLEYASDRKNLPAGQVPWPDTPLTVQPVCSAKVIADYKSGGLTVTINAAQ